MRSVPQISMVGNAHNFLSWEIKETKWTVSCMSLGKKKKTAALYALYISISWCLHDTTSPIFPIKFSIIKMALTFHNYIVLWLNRKKKQKKKTCRLLLTANLVPRKNRLRLGILVDSHVAALIKHSPKIPQTQIYKMTVSIKKRGCVF